MREFQPIDHTDCDDMTEYYARYREGYYPNRKNINSARKDAINYLKKTWDARVAIMKETKNDIKGIGDVYFRDNGFRYYDRKKKTYYILHEWDGSLGPAIERVMHPFGL